MPQITTGALGPALIDVTVNGVKYDQTQNQLILDAQLMQEYGQHDMFHLRIEFPQGTLTTLSLWPDDSPIQITWGRLPDVNTWYGYINHHEIAGSADSGTEAVQLTYVCIGTSQVMNISDTEKWEQVSATFLARTIAAEHGLRSVTTPGGTVLIYEAQTGESDFQFLNRIADKTGMRFWVSGGTLYMISPVAAISGTGQGAIPVFSQDKAIGVADTCRNFVYFKGRNLPGSVQANRVIYGLDKASGKTFSAVANPADATKRVAIKTSYAVQTYADAKARVDAWAALSQFWVAATAQLYGTTDLFPGKLVQLQGGALPDNAAGFWLISRVNHNLVQSGTANPTLDQFITDVTLLRNTTQAGGGLLVNTQPVTPEFVTMTLNTNGQWIATNQATVSLT